MAWLRIEPGTARLQGRDYTNTPTRLTYQQIVKTSYLNSITLYIVAYI